MRLLSKPDLSRGAAVAGVVLVLTAVLSVVLLSAEPSEQERDEGPEELLERIAARTTYGYIDDDLSLPATEGHLEAGRRLFISCGKVSLLAQRMLADRGVESRLAASVTHQAYNGIDDGHTMIEVKRGSEWVLYDLGNNRLAVDGNGEPVGLVEQVRAGEDRRWRVLARDRGIDLRGLTAADRRYMQETFIEGGLRRWYDRMLGSPLLEEPAGSGRFVFHPGRAQIERYDAAHNSGFEWVDAAGWNGVAGS